MIYLVKSVKNEYSEDFINGRLFFNDIEFYHEIEDKKVGDDQEGIMKSVHDSKQGYEVFINGSKLGTAWNVINQMEPKFSVPIKLACFSYIDCEDIEIDINDNINIKESYFKELERLNGERRLFLCQDVEKFMEEIDKSIKGKNIEIQTDCVSYYDKEHPLEQSLNNLENLSNKERDKIAKDIMFYKDIKYQKQKEWRILSLGQKNNVLHIENMKDSWTEITEYV
ncbi:hypothetical protein GCM10025886_01080 [Tetragenococcus halophilus subsp. flandriensis]|uniref:hypothetical protein n=1 Tax=Tetragenococcus halophilus TaxID=51669 RepID=UPI000CC59231|nr:hypothetical protein [Tetragenococcus halophilus]GBD80652.1 hypothetical protein TEHD10_1715 [Tetragenococcus halophilus subsp. halophilus]GFK21216.1 hypothetical protein WJ7_06790 [Tetragenococcus halophilus]GMA06957.1 hypothetical protein GCM10025886_01080 [Tetragenococcus halophilus subsp. flandriensis]